MAIIYRVFLPKIKIRTGERLPQKYISCLCEIGLIDGIQAGKYTSSVHNKRYAIAAVNILSSNPKKTYNPLELWKLVLENEIDKSKEYNRQMHVVLALWDAGLIKKTTDFKY